MIPNRAYRNWVEISLTALQHNYATIRDFVSPAAVCAVVKDNAYGHGSAPCAKALQAEGAKWFAVTDCAEGIELRRAGVSGRILLLAGFSPGEEEAIIEHTLTPLIWETGQINLLDRAAKRLDKAQVPVHLKVDTGMARLGCSLAEVPKMVQALQSTPSVLLEGMVSHLASAEMYDGPDVDKQLFRFETAIAIVVAAGLSPLYCHVCNSAAIVSRPQAWMEMVRPGISLYGYYMPFTSVITGTTDPSFELPVVPVLSWKTRIISLRGMEAHQPIGYSGSYVTPAAARIAVLAVGYGDGLNRHLSNRGCVIVRNQYANIVGGVTMDMTMIDVTAVAGVEIGDEVTLIGETTHGELKITAWDLATHTQTIPYEVLCNIAHRVPRIYVE